jgi:ABC-2 type transport system permease protein
MIVLFFSVLMILAVFWGGLFFVTELRRYSVTAPLHPSMPLTVLFLALGIMVFLADLLSSLGTFFLARDLEILLASPLGPWRFFLGKVCEVAIGSLWMVGIFAMPIIASFGVAYDMPLSYYAFTLLVVLPFVFIPAAASALCVTGAACLLPAHRTKEIVLLVSLVSIGAVVAVTRLFLPAGSDLEDARQLLQVMTLLSDERGVWAPSRWAGEALGLPLMGTHPPFRPVSLLYATCGALVIAGYLSTRYLYPHAIHRARESRLRGGSGHRRLRRMLRWVGWIPSPYRALLTKEYRLFARDMTQAIQLALLLGLCLVYLYNFRLLSGIEGLPPDMLEWWQAALVIANIMMGGLLIIAVSSRFAFPSLSFEGRCFWILEVSPIGYLGLLRAKFLCWFFPVAIVSSVMLGAGASAINAEEHIIAISAVVGWIIAYGIVGLATGLGAAFARFEWEHLSQVAASFGSLAFLLSSVALMLLDLLPCAGLVVLRTLRNLYDPFTTAEWYFAVVSCASLLVYLNMATTRRALMMGAEALARREGPR